MQGRLFSILGLLLLLTVTACDILQSTQNGPVVPLPAEPTATISATPQNQGTPVPSQVVTETEVLNRLTVWLPPALARTEAGAATLESQLLAFADGNPELLMLIEEKPVGGTGGILSYLRNGRSVAPDVLPDLIALPATQLETAVAEELVFPIDGLLSEEMIVDLYPAAMSMAQGEAGLLGYPFALTELSHVAYDSTAITTTFPLNWAELLTVPNGRYIFPAAGEDGALLLLQFYLDAGGTLINEAGQSQLEVDPLTEALGQFVVDSEVPFILSNSNNIATYTEAWQAYANGSSTIVLTTADIFLQETAEISPGFAQNPGLEGPLPPLVGGWAWAVTTPDATQKALVAELIVTLASIPNMGEWSLQNQILPARISAFAAWPEDDPYILFLQELLLFANPNPVPVGSTMRMVLSNALFDVVSAGASPQIAAQEAVDALQQ